MYPSIAALQLNHSGDVCDCVCVCVGQMETISGPSQICVDVNIPWVAAAAGSVDGCGTTAG